jgi:hypothetical protein
MRVGRAIAFGLCLSAGGASAQNFTTAGEVRPILSMTQGNWVALREYNGQDLLYFTHLLAWRCGLSEIRYGLNGDAPAQVLKMEACHEGTAQPNAMSGDGVYIRAPAGSVASVRVRLIFDDGSSDEATFARKDIMQR